MATGAAGLIDEVQNGPRVVLMLAHHDAAQSGVIFDQTLQRKLWERFPALIESQHTPPPRW